MAQVTANAKAEIQNDATFTNTIASSAAQETVKIISDSKLYPDEQKTAAIARYQIVLQALTRYKNDEEKVLKELGDEYSKRDIREAQAWAYKEAATAARRNGGGN